ncbi:TMEM175 family protein [Spirosoma sp.]|uniref:TMEM175 family protein n=1 Tax=Spirosoma sp. TaxID=1899569 RepID=UPI003B3BD94D
MDQADDSNKGFKTDRIKALADGVFGIAMTLLVLDVKESAGQGQEFWEQFQPILAKLFPYTVSFLILGIYWTGHHSQFYFIKHTTRIHLWLNIILLMFVALIPFSAALLSEKKLSQFSVLIYGCNLIAVLLAFYGQWWYATYNHRLIDPKLDNRIVSITKKRMIIQVVFFFIALAASYLNTTVSLVLFLLGQLSYVLLTTQTPTGAPANVEKAVSKNQTENENSK